MPCFDLGEIGLDGVSLGSPMVRVRLEVPLSREELRATMDDLSAGDVAGLSDATIRAMAVSTIVCEGLQRVHQDHAAATQRPAGESRDRQAVQQRVEAAFGLEPVAAVTDPVVERDAQRRQHDAEVRQRRIAALPAAALSDRQRQIAQLRLPAAAVDEATHKEIAERLGVSVSTVTSEWRAIRQALDAAPGGANDRSRVVWPRAERFYADLSWRDGWEPLPARGVVDDDADGW
jgi:DNA-binding CsgD family transcriptional regulator